MAAYFLIEFGGLTEAQRARAVDYAVEEFPHMDDTAQHMLLETSRPPLHDPRLVPVLRSMLAANPSDKDVTAALLAIALERLSAEWQGRQQTEDARKAEVELASALGSYGWKTFIDEAQRRQLGQRCMSDQCRLYLH